MRPAAAQNPAIYWRVTYLKEFDPDLKVFVALGGWTFNDAGTGTETTFSDIARSETNQKAFIKSLISFMSTYDFDGVDIDWEYPVADDRSGRPEDFENFPRFIRTSGLPWKQLEAAVALVSPSLLHTGICSTSTSKRWRSMWISSISCLMTFMAPGTRGTNGLAST